MSSNLEIVSDFIRLWNARDLDAILGAMSVDCFYHNIPWAPLTGHAAIRAALEPFVSAASEIDWVVHHIAESGAGVVLTERTDRFLMGGAWLEIPVMGTFELDGGKIVRWRDYFDSAQMPSPAAEGA